MNTNDKLRELIRSPLSTADGVAQADRNAVLEVARDLAARVAFDKDWIVHGELIRSGHRDDHPDVQIALSALKRGMELAHLSPRITQQAEEVARLREALAYMLRAYEYEARGVEDTLLMVPNGSKVFSVASARAALNEQPGAVRRKGQN